MPVSCSCTISNGEMGCGHKFRKCGTDLQVLYDIFTCGTWEKYIFMKREYIDLFDFQTKMKESLEGLFPSRFWLRAEVSALKARPGGHCYLELSQSSDKGLVAKASAVIWASKYRFIAPYFETVTGSPLCEGMTLLVYVQVNYSQLYGFTLVVDDIDPEFSLGQKEMEKQQTIARLVSEGLMDMQKRLHLPELPYHLAVISAEDAAGYRDFVRHLSENPYGFTYDIELYPALMQGAGCPDSIVAALDCVMQSGKAYDVVLILRGGGSKLDLAAYDDYGLASFIARFPLPVMTAVGHDQDYHICDMVANTFVKTPTALADALVAMYEDADAAVSSLATRIRMAFNGRIVSALGELSLLNSRIKGGCALRVSRMESEVELLNARISAADPSRIMERGFALVVGPDGTIMKNLSSVSEGDNVSVRFSDGTMMCNVEKIETN